MTGIRTLLRTPSGILGLLLAAVLTFLAIAAPAIWSQQASVIDMAHVNRGPMAGHPLGTDHVGRDVLLRGLVAARASLTLSVGAALLGSVLGIPLGASNGILGPRGRRLVHRLVQVGLVFPAILVAFFVITIVGPGPLGSVLAIGVALAPGFARTAETLSAGIATSDYVAAARVIGVPTWRLLRRYVLANIAEPLVLQAFGAVSLALIAVSALSFLGIGIQAPAYDWGSMLSEGLASIYETPTIALAPAVAIVLTGLTCNLLGEATARSLNPFLRPSHSAADRHRVGDDPVAKAALEDTCGSAAGEPVLRVRGLSVSFPSRYGEVAPVAGVNLDIFRGEVVGLVGESGSGKSLLCLGIAQLVQPPGRTTADVLTFAGEDLLSAPRRRRRALLGTRLAMVFQDPTAYLNPALRIGRQLTEAVEVHRGMRHREALVLAEERLREVHMPSPRERLRQYPHEFSGGMRQRGLIAMGLMGGPELIIADEPTTALDVTVQAQILKLLDEVHRRDQAAVLLVSHDLGVISQISDRVIVMYAGRVVEMLPSAGLPRRAAHPYTQAMLSVVPGLDADRNRALPTIPGQPPDPANRPPGCPYAPRCPLVQEVCRQRRPPLLALQPEHSAACWMAGAPEHISA